MRYALVLCTALILGACTSARTPVPDLSWQPVDAGLLSHAQVTSLAFDPASPQQAFAGTYDHGLYRSDDGAQSWQPVPNAFPDRPIFSLLADLAHPGALLAATGDGLWHSSDNGETWTEIPLGQGLTPAEWPANLYALSHDGQGSLYLGGELPAILRSTDDGRSWHPLSPLPAPAAVLSLLVEDQGQRIIAGTDGQGLFISRDAGQTWQAAADIGSTYVAALAATPGDHGAMLARTRRGLFRSADRGTSWQQVAQNIEGRIDAVTPLSQPGTMLLATGQGGIYRSADDGLTWQPWGTLGRRGIAFALHPHPAQLQRLLAGTSNGLFYSDDDGRTWRPHRAGPGYPPARALAFGPGDATVLANADGLYRQNGATPEWQATAEGLPAEAVLDVAISAAEPQRWYAGLDSSGLFASADGGQTWQPTGWDRSGVLQVLSHPADPHRLFIRVPFERLYASEDGGITWSSRWDGMSLQTELASLAMSPHDSSVLIAGATDGIFRSDDGTRSWQPIGPELSGQTIYQVVFDPVDPQRLYAAATKGAFASKDGGQTWQRWGAGLEDITVTSLALHLSDPAIAFAGTRGHGVFQTANSGQSWQPASRGLPTPDITSLAPSPDGRWLWAVTSQGAFRSPLAAPPGPALRTPLALRRLSLLSPPSSSSASSAFSATPLQTPPGPANPPASQPALRRAVHLLDTGAATLALARAAGFDTAVQLFSWREIEPTRGQFHWQRPDEIVAGAAHYGLDLVVRLDQHPAWTSSASLALNAPPDDLADYTRFVRTVAERYRGQVLGYIIWNEPNLAVDWGGQPPDPAAYTSMLCAAHQAIRQADPGALIISAGLAPTNNQDDQARDDQLFLLHMFDAGARNCFDVLAAHPYGFAHPPDSPADAGQGLNFARVEALRQIMVARGAAEKPIWATEMGWAVAPGATANYATVSPTEQAAYLVGAFQRAAREWPWLQMLAVWNLGGENHPEWHGFSLLAPDGSPRPAFLALQQVNQGARTSVGLPGILAALRSALAPPAGRSEIMVLAPDAVVHLGDSQFSEPWMPLYSNRNPSTRWQGTFYMGDPGQAPWQLSLRAMQPNVWGNTVWINGQRLEPALATGDFSGSWISQAWEVPASLLQPGPNAIEVAIGRTLPLLQDNRFAWDDLQIKDIVLRPSAP